MKTKNISFIAIVTILFFVGCQQKSKKYASVSASDICGAGCDTLVFLPNNPVDVKILNQQCANTFAWQSFIALTWPSSPVVAGEPDRTKGIEDWGKPGDLTPMAFGTYKKAEDIFTKHTPKAWGNNLGMLMDTVPNDNKSARSFIDFNKFDDDKEVIDELFQASRGTPWLTDQNGNLIWYEIKTNYTEFDYIVTNKLYDSVAQHRFARKNGIWMPNGAMEIKAAWRIIPEKDYDRLKNRYKMISAFVPKSVIIKDSTIVISKENEERILGLVGLHIIQKTASMPQFHWATFEHEDLAPETNVSESDTDWLFYNPEKYQDPANVSPDVNTDKIHAPIQVVKNPEASPRIDALSLNTYVKGKIKEKSPESVFKHYKLVDSQWPSSAVADIDNNTFTPLKDGGKTPMVLTNVSMETYIQGISCLDCHVDAGIANKKGTQEYGSDYSFIFQMAQKQIKMPKQE